MILLLLLLLLWGSFFLVEKVGKKEYELEDDSAGWIRPPVATRGSFLVGVK